MHLSKIEASRQQEWVEHIMRRRPSYLFSNPSSCRNWPTHHQVGLARTEKGSMPVVCSSPVLDIGWCESRQRHLIGRAASGMLRALSGFIMGGQGGLQIDRRLWWMSREDQWSSWIPPVVST